MKEKQKRLKEFLDGITKEKFTEHLNETFNMYAAATGLNGYVELGTIGNGDYAVRLNSRKDVYIFVNMTGAIKCFKSKLSNNEVVSSKALKYKIQFNKLQLNQ